MEEKKIFLSHASSDAPLANIIAKTISKVTLNHLEVWFSSDLQIDGGLKPGDNWYSVIHRKVEDCDILIVLVTPDSIDKPWIYYEAGLAQGTKKKAFAICVGIKREDLKSPLRELQSYQLTDKRSYEEFLSKTLKLAGIPLDDQSFKKTIEAAIKIITNHKFEKKSSKPIDIEDILERFKTHIDRRFKNYAFPVVAKPVKNTSVENEETYSVRFKLQFRKDNREFIMELKDSDTFQTITNNIYFNFTDILEMFTYLEKWVIVDNKTKNYIVIREIADRIPAKCIFIKNRDYIIKQLSKPYSPSESKPRL